MKRLIENFYNIYRKRYLLQQLVVNNLRLKYRRSIFGYIWSILNPLSVMAIMILVFSVMFHSEIENFPVYLLIGRLCFDFMNEGTRSGMTAINDNASLLKKAYVPKIIFPLATTTYSFLNFIFALGALVIVMIFTKCVPSWHIILFPLILLELYVFVFGLSLILAQSFVRFKDTLYIYNAFIVAWMYLTPIFYPADILKATKILQLLYRLNPMYHYIAQARDVILYHQLPGVGIVVAGLLCSVTMLLLGIWVFYKNQDNFILYI